jgi:hypothetical protein
VQCRFTGLLNHVVAALLKQIGEGGQLQRQCAKVIGLKVVLFRIQGSFLIVA